MSFNWKKMYQKSFAEKKVLKKENDELKEENDELKEKLAYYSGFISELDAQESMEMYEFVNYVEKQSLSDGKRLFGFEGDESDEEEEKEEEKKKVVVCCECNREQENLADMFVYERDLNGVDTVRCGMCALSFYEGKSRR